MAVLGNAGRAWPASKARGAHHFQAEKSHVDLCLSRPFSADLQPTLIAWSPKALSCFKVAALNFVTETNALDDQQPRAWGSFTITQNIRGGGGGACFYGS